MFKLQVVFINHGAVGSLYPMHTEQSYYNAPMPSLPNQSNVLASSNNTFLPNLVTPMGSFYQQLQGNGSMVDVHNPIRKVLLLTLRTKTLLEVAQEVYSKWSKLYPDENKIEILKLQDNNQCDLDPDYKVSDIFDSSNVLYVIYDYSPVTSSVASSAVANRVSSATLNQQVTPNLKAPGPLKRKADREYFDSTRLIPTKKIRDNKASFSPWNAYPEDNKLSRSISRHQHQQHPLQEQINAHSTDNEYDHGREEEEESYRDELEDAEVVEVPVDEDQSNVSFPPPLDQPAPTLDPKKPRSAGLVTSSPLPSGKRITSGMLPQDEQPDLSKLSDDSDNEGGKKPVIPVKKNILDQSLDFLEDDTKGSYSKEEVMIKLKERASQPKKLTKSLVTPKPVMKIVSIENTPLDSSPAFDKTVLNGRSKVVRDVSMTEASPIAKNGNKPSKEPATSQPTNDEMDVDSKDVKVSNDDSSEMSVDGSKSKVNDTTIDDNDKSTSDVSAFVSKSVFTKQKARLEESVESFKSKIASLQKDFESIPKDSSEVSEKLRIAGMIKSVENELASSKNLLGRFNQIESDLKSETSYSKTLAQLLMISVKDRTAEQKKEILKIRRNLSAIKRRTNKRIQTLNLTGLTLSEPELKLDVTMETSEVPLQAKVEPKSEIKLPVGNNFDESNVDPILKATSLTPIPVTKKAPVRNGVSTPSKAAKSSSSKNTATPAKATPASAKTPAKTTLTPEKTSPLNDDATPAKTELASTKNTPVKNSNTPAKTTLASAKNSPFVPPISQSTQHAQTSATSSSVIESPPSLETSQSPASSGSDSSDDDDDSSRSNISSASDSDSDSSSSDSDDSDDEVNLSNTKKKPRVVNAPKSDDSKAEIKKVEPKNAPKVDTTKKVKPKTSPKVEPTAASSSASIAKLPLKSKSLMSLPTLSSLAARELPDVKDTPVSSQAASQRTTTKDSDSDSSDSDSDSDSDDSDSDSDSDSSDDDSDSDSDSNGKKPISKLYLNQKALERLVSKIPSDQDKKRRRKSGIYGLVKDANRK